MRLSQVFIALKHPNYRLWFFGQLVSLLGTWMQMVAQSYLVFELTKSPAFLGYVSFAFGLPSWIFMLYGGVISDRMSRRKLMLIAQSTMMLLAFVLTFSLGEIPLMVFGMRQMVISTSGRRLAVLTNTAFTLFAAVYAVPFLLLTGRRYEIMMVLDLVRLWKMPLQP